MWENAIHQINDSIQKKNRKEIKANHIAFQHYAVATKKNIKELNQIKQHLKTNSHVHTTEFTIILLMVLVVVV